MFLSAQLYVCVGGERGEPTRIMQCKQKRGERERCPQTLEGKSKSSPIFGAKCKITCAILTKQYEAIPKNILETLHRTKNIFTKFFYRKTAMYGCFALFYHSLAIIKENYWFIRDFGILDIQLVHFIF